MRTIYEIDANGVWTGRSRAITTRDGRQRGWVETSETPPSGIARWAGSGWISLEEHPTPPVVRSGTVSRTQAFLALRLGGHITQAEARDAVARKALPTAITTAITGLPVEQQDAAEIRAWGAETIAYGDPLLGLFAAAFSLSASDIDSLWDLAKTL